MEKTAAMEIQDRQLFEVEFRLELSVSDQKCVVMDQLQLSTFDWNLQSSETSLQHKLDFKSLKIRQQNKSDKNFIISLKDNLAIYFRF